MKNIGYIIILFVLFILLACSQKNNKKKIYQEKSKSKFNILLSDIKNDTLEIVSDDNFVWEPFDKNLSIANIKKIMPGIRTIASEGDSLILTNNSDTIFFKKDKENKQYKFYSIIIHSKRNFLKNNISVGMNKSDFFNSLGISLVKFPIKILNVIRFFDPPGDEIEQTYIFKKDTLNKILIKQILH